MRFKPASYVWVFRLSGFTGELRLTASPYRQRTPTFHTGPPLLSALKFRMQSTGNVSGTGGERFGEADESGPKLFTRVPAIITDNAAPPAETRKLGNTLLAYERNSRTPSPLLGNTCDDDSEAESFRDGRTEDVDRDTRSRAFAWCRDFLSGSWKTIPESDFQISIIR